MAVGRLPITKADVKLAKKHVKATIKLEKKKAKEHRKAAKNTSNKASKAYNLSHAKNHMKDVRARQKYAKQVSKVRGR